MPSIYDYLTFTTKIEHDFVHDSKVLGLFSSPIKTKKREDNYRLRSTKISSGKYF
jgi:hypothetical protein